MCEEFFEMKRTPFVRGIPVDMLCHDRDADEIHDRLVYAAKKQLFAVLVGDSGAGKTTLLRRLKDTPDGPDYAVLYLADSKLTPRRFYNGLLEQLGCDSLFCRGDARKELRHQIGIMRGAEKRKLAAVADEGRLLNREMPEEIRFLLNYRTDSENPLALILSGQQELRDKLKKQEHRAIRNRVDIQCFLHPYEYARMKNCIDSRTAYSGHPAPIFSDDALRLIFSFSSGVPRLVNRVCAQSLIYAYQQRRSIIDDRMVQIVLNPEVS